MAAELLAHRREQLVGEVGLAAPGEALVEDGAEHSGRSAESTAVSTVQRQRAALRRDRIGAVVELGLGWRQSW